MPQMGDFFGASTKVLTVGELTRNIRGLLEARIGSVWVQGEVSNYKEYASGHRYFTLKDRRAAISCVIFRSNMVSRLEDAPAPSALADGAQVQVFGNLTVFEARGVYQLSVEVVQPRGLGLLQAKFEALKRKLEAEGLFESARKKPLPKFPKRIGIVTSPSGAAIRDILNVLRRRAPGVHVLISPVRVQGVGAAAEIAAAIHELNRFASRSPQAELNDLPRSTNLTALSIQDSIERLVEVIVLARGGGSIEDLWEFNEEMVARAVAASAVPVVSAVGHEIDFTIADFVADLRAPTPSAAAELIVPDAAELERRLGELRNCVQRCLRNWVAEARARLRHVSETVLGRELVARIRDAQQELDWLREMLGKNVRQRASVWGDHLTRLANSLRVHSPAREITVRRKQFENAQHRFSALMARRLEEARRRVTQTAHLLRAMSPEATLARGYSITTDASGNLIRSVAQVRAGMRLRTRVGDGEVNSEIIGKLHPS